MFRVALHVLIFFSVIAIHGLEAESPKTWIAWGDEDDPKSKNTINWLTDDHHMLPKLMPEARILSYDWNAAFDDDASPDELVGHAKSLLDQVYINRDKTAIVRAVEPHTPWDREYIEIVDNIIGMVFFGTPFQGISDIGSAAAEYRVNHAINLGKRANKELTQYLRQGSAEKPSPLAPLVKRIFEIIHRRQARRLVDGDVRLADHCVCFYERKPTTYPLEKVPEEYRYELGEEFQVKEMMVTEASANFRGAADVMGFDVRHNMLHKFNMPFNAVFESLVVRLRRFVKKAAKANNDPVRLSDEETAYLKQFFLIDEKSCVTYEPYKDTVSDRVMGTCLWFIEAEQFRTWLERDSGIMLVTAGPGCGKSVLAKYLIDDRLADPCICYFFFKDQVQNTVRQALCAIIHQLFSKQKHPIRHALAEDRLVGDDLTVASLWKVLEKAINHPSAGPIVIVLDAIDECSRARSELKTFIQQIDRKLCQADRANGKVKCLVTSTPDSEVLFQFCTLSNTVLQILAEEYSDAISEEVKLVVEDGVRLLSKGKELSDDIAKYLLLSLLDIPHRTYL